MASPHPAAPAASRQQGPRSSPVLPGSRMRIGREEPSCQPSTQPAAPCDPSTGGCHPSPIVTPTLLAPRDVSLGCEHPWSLLPQSRLLLI